MATKTLLFADGDDDDDDAADDGEEDDDKGPLQDHLSYV